MTRMDRMNSTSFQPVEDWLRSLGLLQYAQSFYDNGYEDIETVKLIGEPDLEVINVTSERDRDDILSAVNRLKQNLYFELEVESTEKEVPREKVEPILLKSKLKECLKKHNVQLIEPPYYNPDGTLGDLYPLAIRFAEELRTFFDDVLEALEQLRKRQLPTQSYDQMVNLPVNNNDDPTEKRRSMTLTDPPEYLDVETPNKAPMRTQSFSKYDTRVTKSTTDLTKGLQMPEGLRTSKGKGGKKSFISSVFKRNKEGTKSVRDYRKTECDFNAEDVQLSQDRIVQLMGKVKKNEMSQEDVLAEVKKAAISKSNSFDSSKSNLITSTRKISASSSPENAIEKHSISRKGKLSKSMIKKAAPTAQFYTKDEEHFKSSTSLQSSEDANSIGKSHKRSGSNQSDIQSDSPPSSIKNSPELGKQGLLKSIRNSLRKKGKAGDSSFEKGHSPTSSTSSQENLMLQTDIEGKTDNFPKDLHLASDHVNKDVPKTKKPPPPPIPRRVDREPVEASKTNVPSATDNEIQKDSGNTPIIDDDSVFRERQPSLKIKSYEKYQEEMTKRRSSDKGHSPSASDVNVNSATMKNTEAPSPPSIHAKPKPPPRNVKDSNKDLSQRKPPPRPIPNKRGSSSKLSSSSSSSIETTSIDEIGNQMNQLIAGLNDHLSQLGDKKKLTSTSSGEEASKKPLLPPRLPKKPQPTQKVVTVASKTETPQSVAFKPGHTDKLFFQNELSKSTAIVGKVSHDLQQSEGTGKLKPASQDVKSINSGSLGRVQNVSLKKIISKKLRKESIQLQTGPYTATNGSWNVPYPLIERYAGELNQTIEETMKAFEEIRVDERTKRNQSVVPVMYSSIKKYKKLPKGLSLDQWLVAVGLPMFSEDLSDVEISTIEEVSKLSHDSFTKIGVFDDKHVYLLLTKAKEYVKS